MPHPLSPTNPIVSFGNTLKLTSSTALKNDVGVPKKFVVAGKYTFNDCTDKTGCSFCFTSLSRAVIVVSSDNTISVFKKSFKTGNFFPLLFALGLHISNAFV